MRDDYAQTNFRHFIKNSCFAFFFLLKLFQLLYKWYAFIKQEHVLSDEKANSNDNSWPVLLLLMNWKCRNAKKWNNCFPWKNPPIKVICRKWNKTDLFLRNTPIYSILSILFHFQLILFGETFILSNAIGFSPRMIFQWIPLHHSG